MNVSFKEFDEIFFELSGKWLSDPEIKHLTLTPDSTYEERLAWFYSLKERRDYLVKGIKVNGTPIGAAGIKRINYFTKTGEYFGYIGEKEYIGYGIGKKMIAYMCTAAKNIGLQQLHLNVIASNVRAVHLYRNCGFLEVNRRKGIIQMEKTF